MFTIRVFRELANQVAPRAGSVLRGQLKVHNSKSGTCQGGVFLVYCMMYFMILIYFIILQLSRGASGKEFFGARTHGFCTHQARPTCKNTGKLNNRSRETGTLSDIVLVVGSQAVGLSASVITGNWVS